LQSVGAEVGSSDVAIRPAEAATARGRTPATPFRRTWSRPLASAARVELWFVAAGAHADLARHARVLDRDDWSAIARIRDTATRDQARATRIALRLALSHVVAGAVPPAAWRFRIGEFGKPMVAAGLPEVNFSVSHIETLAVIAVSAQPVGVDIETVAAACPDRVVEATCSPSERRMLAKLGQPERARAFARLWSLKEAHAKLAGTGLAADFRFLEFGAATERTTAGCQAQQIPGVASFYSWLTDIPEGLGHVAVAIGGNCKTAEPGELVCFALGTEGAPVLQA
jgi:4'-phosphopantetheinyl transferase